MTAPAFVTTPGFTYIGVNSNVVSGNRQWTGQTLVICAGTTTVGTTLNSATFGGIDITPYLVGIVNDAQRMWAWVIPVSALSSLTPGNTYSLTLTFSGTTSTGVAIVEYSGSVFGTVLHAQLYESTGATITDVMSLFAESTTIQYTMWGNSATGVTPNSSQNERDDRAGGAARRAYYDFSTATLLTGHTLQLTQVSSAHSHITFSLLGENIEAELSVNDGVDTLSSDGTITEGIEASLTITEGEDSLSADASLTLEASLAILEGVDQLTSAGSLTLLADSSINDGADTLSSAAALTIVAVASINDGADTLSASGTTVQGMEGDLVITEGPDLVQLSAEIFEVGVGILDIQEGADVLSALSVLTLDGDLGIIEGADAIESQAAIGFSGSLEISEGPDNLVSDASLAQGRRSYVVNKSHGAPVEVLRAPEKKKPKMGSPLFAEVGPDRMQLVGTPLVSARQAAAKVLAAYLGRFVFETAPGDDCKTNRFRLNEVFTSWPSGIELPYPAASITEGVIVTEDHALTPTMLEDTFNEFGEGTVLWKTAELAVKFQVDFWLNTQVDREAIRAAIPRMFSPTEGRSGVLLAGDPEYFDRTVRATYIDEKTTDQSLSTYAHERRLTVTILCDVDVVHLRGANTLQPKPTFDITDNS